MRDGYKPRGLGRRIRLLVVFALFASLGPASASEAVVTQDGRGRILALRSPERSDLILRLTASGKRDRSFDENGYRRIGRAIRKVYDAERLANGRTVVIGRPDTGIGVSDLRLAVLRPDGSYGRAVTVGRGRYATAHLTALPDGGLIVAGTTVVECGSGQRPTYHGHIIRLGADLARDRGFGGGDGKTLINPNTCGEAFPWTGYITSPASVADGGDLAVGGPSFLARLEADGDPDPDFGGGDGIVDYAFADSLTLLPDGSIITAVTSQGAPFVPGELVVRRYLADGSPDSNFGQSNGMTSLALEGGPSAPRVIRDQGRLLVAVTDTDCPGPDSLALEIQCQSRVVLFRLDPAGSPDAGFGGGDGVSEMSVDQAFYGPLDLLDTGENRVVEVGARPHVGGAAFPASVVFAFRPDGEPETSFGAEGAYLPPKLPTHCGDRGPADSSWLAIGTPEDDPPFRRARSGTAFFHGLAGNDRVLTQQARGDRYCGGPGNDQLIVEDGRGANGSQHAFGQNGRDIIRLGEGNDILNGGADADRLVGGDGKDEIYGGGGPDLLRARDGEVDDVYCDRGRDVAIVDRQDAVLFCERVRRG